MGAGVAVGAVLLTLSQAARSAPQIGLSDFRVALVVAGFMSAAATLSYVRLAPDVAHEISGHKQAGRHSA